MKHFPSISLALLALSGPLAYAQAAPAAVPPAPSAEAQPGDTLQQDPQLVTGTLDNGLRYIIRPTAEPRGQASLRLFVKTGSLDESPETSGISHFIEHMVFNGSRHFRRGELIPAMQSHGIGFGDDSNAYTGMEHTIYMLDLPSLRQETVDFALTALRDFADGATLSDEDIERERGIIISELRARDSENYRADMETMRKLLGGTRVMEFQPIGTEEVIRNCPADTIRRYYREHYVPSRMTLIIAGDVTPQQAEEWVKQHFASMESRPAPQRPAVGTPAETAAGCFVVPDATAGHSLLTLAVVSPWQQRPDTMAQRMESLPLELACAMLNRRLARLARQPESPVLSASVVPRENACGAAEIFSLSLNTRPEQWQAGLAAAETELRRATLHGFSETELREAVDSINARFRKSMETWGRISALDIAGKLVDTLSHEKVFTTPAEDARCFAAGLQQLQANPDICREALAQAYEAERVRLIMSGKLADGVTPEALASAYATARQQEAAPLEEEQLAPFAYERIGEPGQVVAEQQIADLGITTMTLSNGVRVNLKPIGAGMGRVYVCAAVDGGAMKLPRVPALAEMAQAVMSKGGLVAHSADELGRLFAGHNVSCRFNMDDERFTFSGNTTPGELELQCKLLCAAIMHPGYRADGEAQLRRSLPAFFQGIETTPEGALGAQATASFLGGDPRFCIPTPEQFAAVDKAAAKAALRPFLERGAIELTLVGDFKVEDVRPILERTFAAMPQREAEFSPLPEGARKVAFSPWGKSELIPYETELDKTIVAHVRPAGDGRDLRRQQLLSILRHIVGGRLFSTIRAELGESYSPSVQLDLRQGYENAATIAAMSVGVAGNREKVTAAMESVFASVGRGEILEEELQQVLRPYLSDADMAYRRPPFWMGSMVRLQSEPRALELLRNYRQEAASITLEEIRQLAREVYGSENPGNYYFVAPRQAAAQAEAAVPAAPAAQQPTAAAGETYAVICTATAWQDPAWKAVVLALYEKHSKNFDAVRCVVLNGSPSEKDADFITDFLRTTGARHAAFVMKPGEIGRETVNTLHRATRRVDDDPYGDCMWGIITGATAQDALRLASASEPLIIKRLLATTNVHHAPFEHSCCITDWTNAPVREQSGYTDPTNTEPAEGGREHIFAEQLSTQKPQFLVTSSHATQFNLEMPFGKGLIFPSKGRFHLLKAEQMPDFAMPLGAAMAGYSLHMDNLVESAKAPAIEPDGEPRVWLAAGNCLIGNAQHSPNSMVVTALSAYTCNQFVGYTVPSWYGKGGWGTLSLFFENAEGTSLAEAWYLNNQFILHETLGISPELMKAQFNDEEIGVPFFQQMSPILQKLQLPREKAEQALGLVHDRDVVAFYGDPVWRASVDNSHSARPFRIEWTGEKSFTITANGDHKGRCAVWFPKAATGRDATGCDAPEAVFTNDFILFPELEMKKGETRTINIR